MQWPGFNPKIVLQRRMCLKVTGDHTHSTVMKYLHVRLLSHSKKSKWECIVTHGRISRHFELLLIHYPQIFTFSIILLLFWTRCVMHDKTAAWIWNWTWCIVIKSSFSCRIIICTIIELSAWKAHLLSKSRVVMVTHTSYSLDSSQCFVWAYLIK